MTLNSRSAKLSSPNAKVQDVPNTPTVGTAAQVGDNVNIPFTAAATGGRAALYRAISNPGNIEAISYGDSPILVPGLTAGTSYTFTVRGESASGATAGYTSATNSVSIDYGAMQEISTVVPNGSTRDIDFSNIPQTYTDLRLVVTARSNAGVSVDYAMMYFNDYGSPGSATSYSGFGGNGSSPYYFRTTSTNAMSTGYIAGGSSTNNIFGTVVIDIFNYSNTAVNKATMSRSSADLNGSGNTELTFGLWRSTNAITKIVMFPNTSNAVWMAGTKFTLYGIKAAS